MSNTWQSYAADRRFTVELNVSHRDIAEKSESVVRKGIEDHFKRKIGEEAYKKMKFQNDVNGDFEKVRGAVYLLNFEEMMRLVKLAKEEAIKECEENLSSFRKKVIGHE